MSSLLNANLTLENEPFGARALLLIVRAPAIDACVVYLGVVRASAEGNRERRRQIWSRGDDVLRRCLGAIATAVRLIASAAVGLDPCAASRVETPLTLEVCAERKVNCFTHVRAGYIGIQKVLTT